MVKGRESLGSNSIRRVNLSLGTDFCRFNRVNKDVILFILDSILNSADLIVRRLTLKVLNMR